MHLGYGLDPLSACLVNLIQFLINVSAGFREAHDRAIMKYSRSWGTWWSKKKGAAKLAKMKISEEELRDSALLDFGNG
jgi:hypothetical protein